MKICLVTQHARASFIPLALLYIQAYLVECAGLRAEDVKLLEFPPEATPDEIAEQVLQAGPDVVGVSCYVWNVRALTAAAAALKSRNPAVKIVFGGPEAGPVGQTVLETHPAIDVVVASEGEVTFAELVCAWQAGGDAGEVAGVWHRAGGAVVATPEAPILRDLNTLPSPHLLGYVPQERGRFISIETQRGCVFRCNFCFYNKDLSIRNRRFDLDRVKAEILYWLRRATKRVYLMDPVFNLHAERAKEILRFIAAHNDRGVPFHTEVWAEFIDEEMARLFREANVTFLEVGLQTTDADTLATVERRLRVRQFLDGIGHLKAFKVPFELQLIYGLPGETRASFRRSLDFAASLEPDQLVVFLLLVLPGTELWRKADTLQIEAEPDPPYMIRSHMTMPRDDIAYGHRVVQAVDTLDGHPTVRLLGRELGVGFSRMVDWWIEWQETIGVSGADAGAAFADYIEHVCGIQGIPADFYRACAAAEFRRRTPVSMGVGTLQASM